MRDVMVMVAPNGARRRKQDHPALPITAAELAVEAANSRAAGAAGIHLHVRDANGDHTLDAGRYREAIIAVREAAGEDFVVQITTETADRFSPSDQMACITAVRPEAVSLALREFIPDASSEPQASGFLRWMDEEQIAVQVIIYAPYELRRLFDLIERAVMPSRQLSVIFVLGRYTDDKQSAPEQLVGFLDEVASGRRLPWMMCAFGHREAECAVRAAHLGGHVRVGFENNMHLPDGTLAASNAHLVATTVELLHRAGFDLMSPARARSSLLRSASRDVTSPG